MAAAVGYCGLQTEHLTEGMHRTTYASRQEQTKLINEAAREATSGLRQLTSPSALQCHSVPFSIQGHAPLATATAAAAGLLQGAGAPGNPVRVTPAFPHGANGPVPPRRPQSGQCRLRQPVTCCATAGSGVQALPDDVRPSLPERPTPGGASSLYLHFPILALERVPLWTGA